MKRSVKLILLALVLVALAACYALAVRTGDKPEAGEETGSYPLSALTAEDMTALSWTYDGESRRFEKNGSVWVNADDASFPVNQQALGTMASRIAGLTAVRKLTDVEALSVYGLEEPVLRVTAEGPDGATDYALGDATPFADGYYLSVSGDDAVYTIETSLESAFDKTLLDLAQMETLPDAQDATRICVGEALDATLGEDGAWRDTLTGELLNGEAVASLVEDAQTLSWSALVAVSADDAALTDYGLDAAATRVTLYRGEEEARTLLLGRENDDGDRFARLPDSGMVYTLYGGDVTALLEASADTLFDPTLVATELNDLQEAIFTADGATLTLTRAEEAAASEESAPEAEEQTEVSDEADAEYAAADAATEDGASEDAAAEDGEEAQPPFTANGQAADAQAVADLWALLTQTQATARTDETAQGEAVLSVTVTATDGAQREIAFYAHDVESYLMPVSDAHALLVPADTVDRIVRTVKAMSGQ